MARDLYVMWQTPHLAGGGLLHCYAIVRALSFHRPVDVVFQMTDGAEPSPAWRQLKNVTFHCACPSRRFGRFVTYAHRRFLGVPESLARSISREWVHAAHALADDSGRGRVIADGLIGAAALLPLTKHRDVIYDGQNLESAFRHQVASRGLGSPARFRNFERRVLENMHECWMVSKQDVEQARALAPRARPKYVPNVIDVQAIRPVLPRPGTRRILFVGQFSYPPNRVALRYLLDEVMPVVWSRLSDARLILVGRGLPAEVTRDSRVEARGYVENLDQEYRRADCAVVPLLKGGGTPLKFLEALAYQLPVVATPFAASGLQLRPGEHFLEGADARSFAGGIIDALSSDADQIAAAGRHLVERRYSIETLVPILAPEE